MPKAIKLIYKTITASDFYYINQPGLMRGGGQSYIDFDTSDISVSQWRVFFAGAVPESAAIGGPFWTFSVNNLGTGTNQHDVKIGQRRNASVSIRSQKLPEHSREGRRLHAWSPEITDFPALPTNVESAEKVPPALIAGLTIFLLRDEKDQFWAGWFQGDAPSTDDPRLLIIKSHQSRMIDLSGGVEFDPTDVHSPFSGTAPDEGALENADDLAFQEDETVPEEGLGYNLAKVRKRDRAAVRKLRKLYNCCQISGQKFVFNTKDGKPYLEVHHLLPLGQGGADSPHNMIVISAHLHRMLHFAKIGEINLQNISNNKLDIDINDEGYEITWHPRHAELVVAQNPV